MSVVDMEKGQHPSLTIRIALTMTAVAILWLACATVPPRTPMQSTSPPISESDPAVVWPEIEVTRQFSGFAQPTHITHADDESDRIFIVERRGTIQIIKEGVVLETPFLDIIDRVGSQATEQGLLSVAFPPDYTNKNRFYVNYTDRSGDTVVARYHVNPDTPDVADPASEEVIFTQDQPYNNHNGGQIAFGPDGYLYIGMGDGGSAGDPQNFAQNPGSLLGKLLRIDVESGVTPYAIPSGNPFVGDDAYRDEIWALGLRNPWRFSFDRETGDLYIADVGQNAWEEVNFQPASSAGGENYGWRIMEGTHCYNPRDCDPTGLVLPVAEYANSTYGCSITGGMVYRGDAYPAMHGIYFFGDYCSGRIWGLQQHGDQWHSQILLHSPLGISTFGKDEAGNIYLSDYFAGDIYVLTGHRAAEQMQYLALVVYAE